MVDTPVTPPSEEGADFAQLLAAYENQSEQAGPAVGDRRTGHVVNLREDVALVDIGAKAEGVLPLEQWRSVRPGVDLIPSQPIEVVVEGRDPEGSFRLSPYTPDRPRSLEDARLAFEQRTVVKAKVTGVVKGGLTVDVGMRGFIPQSKSGVRDPAEMHKLVGQEVRCRIAKMPEDKSDLVLDRRSLLEEQEAQEQAATLVRIQEGDEVSGTVTSLATYGAFVNVGGLDALLHVSDMSWTRVGEPGQVLTLGQQLHVKVLKIDREKRRISIGIKQLTADPWAGVEERFPAGARVRGVVTRTSEFGAFVELEPGIEGMIHVSEMSWTKRIRRPEDAVKTGETVETAVLSASASARRISLGLKQVLGDPWADAATKFKPGSVVEGKVRNLQQFGAFVELAEGVDGMIHIGDICPERIQHPSAKLNLGDVVRAQVLELDLGRRRIRLGMKQLIPTPFEVFIGEHAVGDILSGRVVKAYPGRVQLDDAIEATCPAAAPPIHKIEEGTLAAKLAAVWKPQHQPVAKPEPEIPTVQLKSGEIRKFRITRLESDSRRIEVEVA